MPRIPEFKEKPISTRVPVARVNERMLTRTYEALKHFGDAATDIALDVAMKRKKRNDNISVNDALEKYALSSQNEFQEMGNTYDAQKQQVPSSGMDYADHYQDWNQTELESIVGGLPNDDVKTSFEAQVARHARANVLNADSQELSIKRKFMDKKDVDYVNNALQEIEKQPTGRTGNLKSFLQNSLFQRYAIQAQDGLINPIHADTKFKKDANAATFNVLDGEIDSGHLNDVMDALLVDEAMLKDLGEQAGYKFKKVERKGEQATYTWTEHTTGEHVNMGQPASLTPEWGTRGDKEQREYLYKQLNAEQIIKLRKKLFKQMITESKKNVSALNDLFSKTYNLNISGELLAFDPEKDINRDANINEAFHVEQSKFVGIMPDHKISNNIATMTAARLVGQYKNKAKGMPVAEQLEMLANLPNLLDEELKLKDHLYPEEPSLIGMYKEWYPDHIVNGAMGELAKGGSAFRNVQREFAHWINANEQSYQTDKVKHTIDTNADVRRANAKWMKSKSPNDFKEFLTQTRASQMVRGTPFMDTIPLTKDMAVSWGKEFMNRLVKDKSGVAAEQYLREKTDSVMRNSNDTAVLDFMEENKLWPKYVKHAMTFPTSAEGREIILSNNINRAEIIKALPGKATYESIALLADGALLDLRSSLLQNQYPANAELFNTIVDQVALSASQKLGAFEATTKGWFRDPSMNSDKAIKDASAELLSSIYIPPRNKLYNIIIPRNLFKNTSKGQSIETEAYIQPMMEGFKADALYHARFRISDRVKKAIIRMNPEFEGNENAIQARYRSELEKHAVVVNAGADRVRLIDGRTGAPIIYTETLNGKKIERDSVKTFFEIRNLPKVNQRIKGDM